MPSVFIIRGFGKKRDSKGTEYDFNRVQAELIEPAMKRCGLEGGTTATQEDAGNIREDMFAMILEADLVICDITVHNANVFYELGIRHALRRKHTVMIRGEGSADVTPFDIATDRYLAYDPAEPARAVEALTSTLQATLLTHRETDSPIFLLLPTLTEANPSEVTVVPLDLMEEVERAETAKDKAWLRVIAEDLQGQRYERDARRVVARALWSLKDLDAAQAAWEAVRASKAADVEANLALANIYERQYRRQRREALLTASDQAIRRVLEADKLSTADRAEALALQGRNAKTLWRTRFEKAPGGAKTAAEVAEARKLALNAKAMEAYRAYREAFDFDLNKFYPGIAALQMGRILRELAQLPTWPNLFGNKKKEAERAREDLDDELPALAHVVEAATRRAQALEKGDEKMYADITAADLLFLSQPDEEWQADPSAIVAAYRDAMPQQKVWASNSAREQLELFECLGFRAPVVAAVREAYPGAAAPKKAQHLIVFTGHGIDAPGAVQPRFPAAAEARARALIKQHLSELLVAAGEAEELTLLASGAPGADILAHEVAKELGIAQRLCLPMPKDDVSRIAFKGLDAWRGRFLDIAEDLAERTVQMADHDELPRWLPGRGANLSGRGDKDMHTVAEKSGIEW